ncbi:S1 family peptidase [Streptomyces sp. CMB-StM0423]|uniref:S1 family peptidase n=1 Tax=Streptomyces sp. CMB-StM0423 TaxID=2059884 RepID=UPI000C70B0A7|nr:trypsin-like serine protease [Streptomyces sp. CMB-StM0423]AUH38857.1 esterase [Streptomyces sp. CMB-StM0423]
MKKPRTARSVWAALTAVATAAPLALAATPAAAVVGTPQGDNTYGFTSRLIIGDFHRGCSATLVDQEWLLTAASCFADDPATDIAVAPGKPKVKTVATIGRTNVSDTSAGQVRDVVELVPYAGRDVVLARLARPVFGVPPVAVSATAPSAGEELRVAGYGRTAADWAPDKLHTGAFTVDTIGTADLTISGQDGAAVCGGDTGGPAVRVVNGTAELVALSSRSYQVGCFGIETADGTPNSAVSARVDDLRSWIDGTVGRPRYTDFNCDGAEDVAIADPNVTVGGAANAGLVRIVFGGGKGTAEITQNLAGVPGGAEPNDQFGRALATYDQNEDGCTDLVVGIPYEDLGGAADAGMASLLYGAPGGLTTGQTSVNYEQGSGSGDIAASVSEAGDRMGAALAAGHTTTGEPYLVIGDPGEDVGSGSTAAVDAGGAYYLRGTVNEGFVQGADGVSGGPESGDDFGATLAATPQHIAIGVPGEGLGSNADAGGVQILEHTLSTAGIPRPIGVVNQDQDDVTGAGEAGDRFSDGLAGVPYRPAGSAAATDSIFFVGAPGEDVTVDGTARADAGGVFNIQVTGAGVISQHSTIWQGNAGVSGGPENGDRFGATFAAANTRPKELSSADNLALAVGAPGEDLDGVANAGAVQTFAPLWSPGDSDRWIQAGSAGLPGSLGANQQVGSNIQGTGRNLYVGMPYGPSPYGAMHALPWPNVRGWPDTSSVTSHEPGKNGLPAVGTRFGWAMQ